jgi:hypothetical protein
MDVTQPPQPAQPKNGAAVDGDTGLPVVFQKNPYQVMCTCGKCPVMLTLPMYHCPKCHVTYKLRKLGFPNRCNACQFDYRAFLRRNNLTFTEPVFA